MQQFLETLTDAKEHLALDEALLLSAEAGEIGESIRLWEFVAPTVVVGRSTKVGYEVDRPFCESQWIPILRRCSGGASIVGGPGCLMYSVVISLQSRPELRKIDAAHRYVMQRVFAAAAEQLGDTSLQGTCDLTWRNRKFSGNSLRISREYFLYHGTILYDADLQLLARCLRDAPRQPEYRAARDHDDFVTNAPIDPARFTKSLVEEFSASSNSTTELPWERMQELMRQRYELNSWNFRH